MKRIIVFLLSAAFLFAFFSCGSDKPAENLADLQKKYKDKEFKNCDEFIVAYEEALDVYFDLLSKDFEGDEQAAKDIEELEVFVGKWDKHFEKFEQECPAKIEELNKKIDKKMDEYFDLIYGDDFDEEWELEDEISDEEFTKLLDEMTEEDWAEFNAALESEHAE